MRALVVFYSRSGRTRGAGLQIAERLGADIEEIKTRRSYRGFLGLWRSAVDALRRVDFAIETPTKPTRDYDIVVVGAPVWGGQAAAPVLTYLAGAKGTLRKVAFFVTSGGAQRDSVFDTMEQAAGAKAVAKLALSRQQLRAQELSASIDRFAGAIKGSS